MDIAPELERAATFNPGAADARFVELKPGRAGPCLFLVPGTGGRVEGFAELAALIQTPMPVLAIEARGVGSEGDPDSDIDEMITHYLSRIAAVQPQGPYFLLGHSFGGMVAFEMAQRLIDSKKKIGCLILLDTVVPKRYWPASYYLANIGTRLRDHFVRLFTTPVKASISYYFRRISLRIRGLHNIPTDLKYGRDKARMLLANEMLLKKWEPKFYPEKLTLFSTSDMKDLATIWRDRATELDSHFADGGHLRLIEQPYVSSLARMISACLAKVTEPV